ELGHPWPRTCAPFPAPHAAAAAFDLRYSALPRDQGAEELRIAELFGPLGSGEMETIRHAGARARMHARFRQHRMCCRKPRLHLTDPRSGRGRGLTRRLSGSTFSLVRFLLDKQEK